MEAVLLPQLLLRRRTENQQQQDETAGPQSHPDEQTACIAHHPLPEGRVNAVVSLGLRIIYIVYFTHLFGNISVVYAAKVIKTSYLCTVFLSF